MATKNCETGKDFVGNLLEVGDLITYAGGGVSELNLGKLVGFTEKSVRVQPIKRNGKSSFGGHYSSTPSITRTFKQVALLHKKDVYGDVPQEWLDQLFS